MVAARPPRCCRRSGCTGVLTASPGRCGDPAIAGGARPVSGGEIAGEAAVAVGCRGRVLGSVLDRTPPLLPKRCFGGYGARPCESRQAAVGRSRLAGDPVDALSGPAPLAAVQRVDTPLRAPARVARVPLALALLASGAQFPDVEHHPARADRGGWLAAA